VAATVVTGRTEQQVAADARLEEAVRTAAVAYGFGEDAEFVGDWMVVAELPQLHNQDRTIYATFWSGGHLPVHRSYGLIEVATRALDAADDDPLE
jgi:hypothetical protein